MGSIRTLACVRAIFAAVIILATATVSQAQEQEKKLIDRLLKPNMSLQSDVQGKTFVPRGTISTRKAATKSFYVANRSPEKGYTNVRKVAGKVFYTQESQLPQRRANTTSRTTFAKLDTPYATSAYSTRAAFGVEKKVETSEYAGTRPFLVRGKSPKALSSQNHPMTIDEVRELLNKNK